MASSSDTPSSATSHNEPPERQRDSADHDVEPWVELADLQQRRQNLNVEADNNFNPNPNVEVRPHWCSCKLCPDWENEQMNICCQDHAIWNKRDLPQDEHLQCITGSDMIMDCLRPGPLRLQYQQYCATHPQRYPNADTIIPCERWTDDKINKLRNKQRRFSAYRSMVFWAFPEIRRKQRRPLPACLYLQIRMTYPPHDDEEIVADHQFSNFMPEAEDEY